MGTQHWPGDVYWFLLQHGGLRQYGRIIIAWGDYNSSVSLIDLCSLFFHSVRPLALRPVTTDAAREGLVKISSRVSLKSCPMIPLSSRESRSFFRQFGMLATVEDATEEPCSTAKPSDTSRPVASAPRAALR